MNNQTLTIIASLSENNVIGIDGKLPWHISEDLQRFKNLTKDHAVIMGRRTYKSILKQLGGPLPDRLTIVVTRRNLKGDIIKCRSIYDAIKEAKKYQHEDHKVYIAGGQIVYEHTIGLADRLELTEVHADFEGDTTFPRYDPQKWIDTWQEIKRKTSISDEGLKYSFVDYIRRIPNNKL